jgi:cytochrome P450
MGIPLEDFEYLRALGTNMVRALDLYQTWKDLVELNETSTQFVKYFSDLIARRPKNGLLGKLIAANDREKVLNEQQMISIAIFLFIAGEETIAASISTSLHDLIQRPQLYQSIRSNRQILRTTGMDEFFRFNGPVHLLGRISKVDVVVDGVLIPADSPITLALASANRDPRQFADPDNIDLRRSPNPHLSFGYGTHFCLGEWLGKLQTTIATEKFISKFSAARVETKNIEWMQNIAVRGMTSLIVTGNE